MSSYFYANVQITNLSVTAVNINRTIGVMPSGLTDADNNTTVYFSTDLTPEQKTALDTFMAGTNLDVIPVDTGKTIYIVDQTGIEAAVKAQLNTTVDMYPTINGYEIHFGKALTTAEKNSLRGIYTSTITEKV